jgi:hypothetical protein
MADVDPTRLATAAGHRAVTRQPAWRRLASGESPNRQWSWTWAVCGVLIGVAVVLNQSAVHWRANVVDSHLFAYHGWCVAQGARPYLDIWDNKPPGIWWANAAGFRLCGEGMGGELLICSVALTISLVAFVGMARFAYHPSLTVPAAATGCVLLTHLVYECGANRTETFVVACESLAMLGYLRWWRFGNLHALALGGLAAGAAPFFKQSGLAVGAACALHLAWTQLRAARTGRLLMAGAEPGRYATAGTEPGRYKPWGVAAGMFAVVPAYVTTVLAAQGALGAAWYALGPFNQAYFAVGDATWVALGRAIGIYWEVLTPLAGLLALAAAGLLWSLWSRWHAPRRQNGTSLGTPTAPVAGEAPALPLPGAGPSARRTGVVVIWLWFLLGAYLACVGPGRRGHHLMPVLPALGLLALYPLHKLMGAQGLARRVAAHPAAAAALVLYGYVLAQLAAANAPQLANSWKEKTHWYAWSYATPRDYQRQAAEVRRLTRPDEPIYVWGWSPGTYRYAYRPAASRFATLEKLGQVGVHARFILDAAMADVRRAAPKVLLFSAGDLHGVLAEPISPFGAWLAEHYHDQGVIGGMHVLLRRGGP